MRLQSLPFMLLLPIVASSLGCDHGATGAEVPLTIPTAVNCGDAQQLNERARDDRRRVLASSSDQERVSVGNRANFFASMATVADLKCRVTSTWVDEALKPALEAARKAETASSFYQRTIQWQEANFVVTQVTSTLVQQFPPVPGK